MKRNTFRRFLIGGLLYAMPFLAEPFYAADGIQGSEEVRARLEGRVEQSHNKPRVFGVLVNNDGKDVNGKHKANIESAHSALIKKGVLEEDIFILSPNYTRTNNADTARNTFDCEPTRNNLAIVNSYLATKGKSGDIYIFYLTGEGRRSGNMSFFYLNDLDISALDFSRNYLRRLKPENLKAVIADQCNSGGFVDEIKGTSNVVVITSTDLTHDVNCRLFSGPFWKAFYDADSGLQSGGDARNLLEQAYRETIEKVIKEKIENGSIASRAIKNDVFPRPQYYSSE